MGLFVYNQKTTVILWGCFGSYFYIFIVVVFSDSQRNLLILLDAGAECVVSKGNILVLLRQNMSCFFSRPLKHDAFLEMNLLSIFIV